MSKSKVLVSRDDNGDMAIWSHDVEIVKKDGVWKDPENDVLMEGAEELFGGTCGIRKGSKKIVTITVE